jgi:hypothetical protein
MIRLIKWFAARLRTLMQKRRPLAVASVATIKGAIPRLVLIAPAVDDLTQRMADWLIGVQRKLADREVLALIGPNISHDAFLGTLGSDADSPMVLTFYGHGCEDALLTGDGLGPRVESAPAGLACLCLPSHLISRNVGIIAFCCSAAGHFAKRLCDDSTKRSVLGFKHEIGFVLGTAEREVSFSTPAAAGVAHACARGQVDADTLEKMRAAYRQQIPRWDPKGDMAGDELAPFVAMFLREQLGSLRLVRRGA